MLLPEENKILEVKYADKQFGKMDPIEIILKVSELILTINAITGWSIPSPEIASILDEQLARKMTESYANVNAEEVKYAFRTYGTTVKDWGKSMNLSLIDEVMLPYLEARRELSKVEEQKKEKLLEAPKETMSDQTYLDWYTQTAAEYKSGKLKPEFLPPSLTDWLVKRGRIEIVEFYKPAAVLIGQRLRTEGVTDKQAKADYHEFKGQYEASKKGEPFTGKWPSQIENLAKRMALQFHIENNMIP